MSIPEQEYTTHTMYYYTYCVLMYTGNITIHYLKTLIKLRGSVISNSIKTKDKPQKRNKQAWHNSG